MQPTHSSSVRFSVAEIQERARDALGGYRWVPFRWCFLKGFAFPAGDFLKDGLTLCRGEFKQSKTFGARGHGFYRRNLSTRMWTHSFVVLRRHQRRATAAPASAPGGGRGGETCCRRVHFEGWRFLTAAGPDVVARILIAQVLQRRPQPRHARERGLVRLKHRKRPKTSQEKKKKMDACSSSWLLVYYSTNSCLIRRCFVKLPISLPDRKKITSLITSFIRLKFHANTTMANPATKTPASSMCW